MKFLISCLFLFLISVQNVLAQADTSEFNIRLYAGTDSNPPTTPVLLSVIPIAQTQIDLSWSSSTDDILLSGYSVLRDGTPIATTTLLSYSDTGLTASTTYSYTVTAFDSSFNYSTTSNSIATTTPDNPPAPDPDPKQGEGTASRVVIDELIIDEGVSTTSLEMTTAHPSRIEIRWGRSASYELGYIVSDVFSREHAVLLTDLEPGTKYEFEIIGYSAHGYQSLVKTGSFVTKIENIVSSPVNVSRFTAVENGKDVDLSWELPSYGLISHVRIVRSHLGYPEHPQDGAIVYQGLKGQFRDEGILNQFSPVYYTAFVYDTFGNVSSGAVTIVYASSASGLIDRGEDSNGSISGAEKPIFTEESTTTVNTERVTIGMRMPGLNDITLSQHDNLFTMLDSNIALDSEQVFLISIPSKSIAGNLKSIIATFVDPTNNKNSYSFLLRINNDQSAYEATVEPLGVVGESQMVVDIYDYEAFVVATYKSPIVFEVLPELNPEKIVFPDVVFENFGIVAAATFIPLILIFILILFYKSRAEDNE